jgi:hypothetical protein
MPPLPAHGSIANLGHFYFGYLRHYHFGVTAVHIRHRAKRMGYGVQKKQEIARLSGNYFYCPVRLAFPSVSLSPHLSSVIL